MLDKNISYYAGEDQITLDRNTKGVWTITIKHNCKVVDKGLRYLVDIKPLVAQTLDEYNKIEFKEKDKK